MVSNLARVSWYRSQIWSATHRVGRNESVGKQMLLSSNTYSYSKLPEFHYLKSMGKQIIPLIMEQLIEPSNFHLLVLYEAVQEDSRKIVKDHTGGEQNRAIMNVKRWLGSK